MMTLTATQLTAWIGLYLWPLFRIGAALMVSPLSGARTIPPQIRAALAVMLTLIVAPLLPEVPAVDPFSWAALTIIFQQLLIGISIGFVFQLIFSVAITAGSIISMPMGLAFAQMVDPQNGTNVPILGQLYLLLTTLLFLAIDGHLMVIELLVESFHVMPIAASGLDRDAFWAIAAWGSSLFSAALWMALPAVVSLLMINIAFGVMTRAAPQLNLFVVGMPVTMVMGFLIIYYTIPTAMPQFSVVIESALTLISRVLGGV